MITLLPMTCFPNSDLPPELNRSLLFKHKRIPLFILAAILLLTLLLHLGALTSDIRRGIPDWHPDSARYIVQCREYIKHNYRPIGTTPWYTGNPYANILMLSYIWHGLDQISVWTGYGHIPLTKLYISIVSRLSYLSLCLLLTLLIYSFASHVFQSQSIGLLSALIWALSPLSINLNHIIKPEIPLTFFITLTAIIAYKLSEKSSFWLYVLGGITAGIAAALKYNGAIVLVYLYLMHTYRIYKKEQRKKISFSFIFHTFFSFRLFIAGIFSLLTFYVFEPILWLGLKKGLVYIFQYIHVSAYAATPPELKVHTGLFPFLFYSIKTMPHNLWIFAQSANPFILLFAIIGIFLSESPFISRQLRIALFPLIILLILFSTKPLIGEEFLLHFMPFVFILAALGLYFTYRKISAFRIIGTKIIASLTIVFTFAFCLYGSLYEIKYFSLGNIRYHTQKWVQKNLNGQCIHVGHHTLRHYQNNCRNKQPVALVTYTKSSFPKKVNGFILKTFNLEKSKPLIHLLRGYKIRVIGSQKFFDTNPYIPELSLPCLPSINNSFVRFLNGVNLNPAYNDYFLHPNTTYTWTIVSKQPHPSFRCYIVNGDGISFLKSHNLPKSFTLLPYERKVITIFPSRSFPWRSPYLYTFSLRSTQRLYVKVFFKKMPVKTSFKNPLAHFLPPDLSTQKAASYLSTFTSKSPRNFRKTFRSLFHYDFSLLEKFLSLSIPVISFKNSTIPRPFFKPASPKDSYVWKPSPIFCEKGRYILKGNGNLFLPPHSRVTFVVMTLGHTLAEKTVVSNNINNNCHLNYRIKLPFQIASGAPVYFVIIQRKGSKINLNNLSLQIPFNFLLKNSLQMKIVWKFLKNEKQRQSLFRYVREFNPEDFPISVCQKIGKTFLAMKRLSSALPWFQTVVARDPLNRNAWKILKHIYQTLSKPEKAQQVENKLNALSNIETGYWKFQTGLTLRSYTISHHTKRMCIIPISLYLNLLNYNGDITGFVYFTKNGNTYFGKDFNLSKTSSFGAFQRIDSYVHVPEKIPTGVYQIYFTFRMPRIDKRYHLLKNGNPSIHESVSLGTITID